MKKLIILLLYFPLIVFGQDFTIKPYLQNARPNSITIMWEYSNWDISFVEWGNTNLLGNIDSTTFDITSSSSCLFTAKLTNLESNTKYFYRVVTGESVSEIFDFYTQANNIYEKSINMIVMSDMQNSDNNPTKFSEIINDGIIDYMQNNYVGNINENLDMILIPGDLVSTGTNHDHWKYDFFAQSEPLFSAVPFYPVLGNHEENSNLFFQYMDLPKNGSPGYEEHWWYKDNSNVRIIGLNSNSEYQIQMQLDWLDSILNMTSLDTSIDFVFAQLHHPHKSELWTPGNTDFSGDVISLLENFTANCGKPSIHFYGHTHGYSRGQSKNHNHLMVNVATSGGYIDYWGEWPQQDYEEYSISQDEWGYIFLEVEAGSKPQFTLKRLSIGDDFITKKNSIEDSVTIRLHNNPPKTPVGVFPLHFDTINSNSMILIADNFFDQDGDLHGSSHWQVSNNCNDFTSLVFDSWKQHENWYLEINTQANDDLTDEILSSLNSSSNYCWRVRYRDRGLSWSEWSNSIPFSTDNSIINNKLIKIVDILGKEVNIKSNMLLFYVYSNGTVEKRIIIE